jgi:hypothetical protein
MSQQVGSITEEPAIGERHGTGRHFAIESPLVPHLLIHSVICRAVPLLSLILPAPH